VSQAQSRRTEIKSTGQLARIIFNMRKKKEEEMKQDGSNIP
jgi:hypothetical protein